MTDSKSIIDEMVDDLVYLFQIDNGRKFPARLVSHNENYVKVVNSKGNWSLIRTEAIQLITCLETGRRS